MDIPDFSAYELNQLMTMGKRSKEYADARQLILSGMPLTERQIKWLFAIKKELRKEG